jgi:SAM-dependent methyltransferase
MTPLPEYGFKPGIASQLAENLTAIGEELAALSAEIQAGEPQLKSITLRGRVGLWLKRRLYRSLWWHSYQIRTAVGLIDRWTREQRKLALELETRLHQVESAQLGLRVSEIERTLRENGQEIDKLGQRLETRLSDLERLAHETATNLAHTIESEDLHKQQIAGLSNLLQSAQETITGLAQRVDAESEQRERLAARLSELGLFTHQTRASLSMQDRRLALFIEEARKRLPDPLAHEDLRDMVNDHAQHRFDSLYGEFEDVFRGTRENVKERQEVYLPVLKEHAIGSPAMPLLDLGCGRGEWVELLSEHGLQARGVDLNEAMFARCRALGLEVVQADALPYLRSLPAECFGAVTAFHLVEHMPFDVVLSLVDESLRVLKPGGLLILETPNPANLQVGTLTFHLDPTHRKPLPSAMLRFFVEGRGFCDVLVQELHPYPEVLRLAEDGNGAASRLNEWLYGPQDYAVIGRKA